MMMMNFSMSRQTTTTCYALLSVLLVASLALVVTPANTKNGMANTTPDDNNVFMRKLMEENDEIIFSRSYISVTQADDFVTLFPNGGDTGDFLDDFQTGTRKAIPKFAIQGSSTTQKGDIFDSSSIEVVNAPEGVKVPGEVGFGEDIQVQFAGNRRVRFTPQGDPYYFFHGQCVATSGILEPPIQVFPSIVGPTNRRKLNNPDMLFIPQPVITSNSCRLNLCLGGGGFSCIAIYSGSAFVFNFGKGIALNNAAVFPARRLIGNGLTPLTFEAPPLPPPFPGTIIGGTGSFEGITGSVSIATIAGTTGPLVQIDSSTGRPFFRGGLKPLGSIVQVITVKSNMPLPTGP